MEDLLQQMRRRKSVQACIDLALTDVYGEDEEAVGWSTCIETTFGRFKRVRLMGEDVVLAGFDGRNHDVVAACRQGTRQARASLDSLEFPDRTPIEACWLQATERYSRGAR